jgi:endonuclease YncB( thermonuclease family)
MRRVLAVLFALLPSVALADVTGPARVIDGDTIEVAGRRVRLHGIDAPERDQSCRLNEVAYLCGIAASGALQEMVEGEPVTCHERDRDRYGRVVAVCYVAGEDVGAAMVRDGWALAYRRYSTDYVDQEDEAREAGAGLWAGDFMPPWEWRHSKRR